MNHDNNVKLKEKLMELAVFFKKVCEENNLNYYMVGGTLLGAIRHKGFIPWDDDMDFAMPRADYVKFFKVMEKLNDEQYELHSYTNTQNFTTPFFKLIDKNTTLIEKERLEKSYYSGCFIDIFPIDYVGKTEKNNKALKKVSFYKRLISIHETPFFSKNLLKKFLGFLIRLPRNDVYIHKLHKALLKCGDESSACMGNLIGAYAHKEIVPKEWFGIGAKYDFENEEFNGPVDFHSYLKNIYGDYMKLPPIEKRIGSHIEFLDLDLPYREYNKNNK